MPRRCNHPHHGRYCRRGKSETGEREKASPSVKAYRSRRVQQDTVRWWPPRHPTPSPVSRLICVSLGAGEEGKREEVRPSLLLACKTGRSHRVETYRNMFLPVSSATIVLKKTASAASARTRKARDGREDSVAPSSLMYVEGLCSSHHRAPHHRATTSNASLSERGQRGENVPQHESVPSRPC